MPAHETDPLQFKSVVRQRALDARDAAHRALDGAEAQSIAEHFLADIPFHSGQIVSGYIPIRSEANPVPLMEALGARGLTCALPSVVEAEAPLVFRRWAPGEATVDGPFGTQVAPAEAPIVRPDILLVPLLAFDLAGHRLGYGGGFYDRSLDEIRRAGPCLAVGIGFSAQERDHLPRDDNDQPLDWVVTEMGARRFQRGEP